MDTTLDGLLNRQIVIEQPKIGFRVAVDTIFLAAAVPAQPQQRVLDMGCGVGGAMLCLGFRVPTIQGIGVDAQRKMVDLCRQNINRNGLQANLTVQEETIPDLPAPWAHTFDHVMMNPPYHNEGSHSASIHVSKRTANTEKEGSLILWIKSAFQCLKKEGVLTIIHRADRKNEICNLLAKYFGQIEVLPLFPKIGTAPKRVLIRAYIAGVGMEEVQPLILHQENGNYTQHAESILRYAQAIDFIRS